MNRKDFELIARTVKKLFPQDHWRKSIAGDFADALGKSSGFDRAKFLKACGVSNAP